MTREEFSNIFPELIKNYQPSEEAVAQIGKIKLLMVVGPSGVGKTSIINRLELPYVAADITRPPRPEEKGGVDYHFRNDYEHVVEQIKNGEFVQVAIGPGGDFYSTLAGSYPDSGAAVMAVVHNAVNNFRNLKFKETISVFITPPSFDEWIRRLDVHHHDAEQRTRRLVEAARSLEFALNDPKMHFILNDDLGLAAAQTKNIVDGNVDEVRENQARKIAQSLFESVSYNKDLSI